MSEENGEVVAKAEDLQDIQAMIDRSVRGVQKLLDENREYQRRWCDADALRARLIELMVRQDVA